MGGEPRPEDYVPAPSLPQDPISRLRRLQSRLQEKCQQKHLSLLLSYHILRSSRLPTQPTSSNNPLTSSPSPQISSHIFRLPYEIRERIILLAFCNQKIHLDLEYTTVHASPWNPDPFNTSLGQSKRRIIRQRIRTPPTSTNGVGAGACVALPSRCGGTCASGIAGRRAVADEDQLGSQGG
ncbi:Hypothetical protein D9617_6g094410 [Elsinoe fawcettii]|nr:Hypothetical protein D9617_6g094410 [Elsinoe fawcettii]